MIGTSVDAGHVLTIVLMAAALGMDAFSLGIGVGMRGIRLLDILRVSFVVGLFHMIMPLMGILTGTYVGVILGDIAIVMGGVLLVLLGAHMIYSSFRENHEHLMSYTTFWGLIVFALSVSLDSFSVGVTLGLFSSNFMLTIGLFGLFGGIMSIVGLWLGRSASNWLGIYSEAIGGLILLVFGIHFLV